MPPTGYAELYDGTTKIGTYTLDSTGKAVAPVPLADGDHELRGKYLGDALNAGSDSAVVSEQIQPKAKAPTTTVITPDANPGTDDVPVKVTIQVSAS